MKFAKVQITIVTILLSLSLLVVSTYAWYALNNKTKSQNMGLEIQSVSSITTISCYALKYDGVYGASCYLIDDENNSITMTEYDKIFEDRNVNTPLICRIEIANVLTTEGSYITITVPCNEKYILKTQTNESLNSYDADYISSAFTNKDTFDIKQQISNVVRVTIGAGDNSLTPTETDSESNEANIQIFNDQHTALKAVEDGDRSKAFCQATKNTSSNIVAFRKVNEVQVRMEYADYSSYLYDAQGADELTTSKHLILYLMLDYDTDLMKTFIETLDDEENTYFESDLGTISIDNRGA